MAFPYLFYTNFEDGTIGSFDSETDTTGRLDVAHYSDLARVPGLAMPWRGAYALRANLATSATTAYLQEDGSFDTAADGTIYVRFKLWVSPDITMATTNEFVIFALQSTGPVDEAVIAINYTTAAGLRIGVGETAATSFLPLPKNQWVTVELAANVDAGGGNDGTLNLYVDGAAATQVTALDQAAIIQARMGVMGQDAGTTAGVVLFDEVIADDARIYGAGSVGRFVESVFMPGSGHVWVGHGRLENVTLSTGFTDNVLEIYDTDTGNTNDISKRRVYLTTANQGEVVDPAGMPITLTRGCYVKLSGTAGATGPFATVKIGYAVGWGSDGAIRNYGQRRQALPQNV